MIDADDVFFENPDVGRLCLGGAPFEYILICTRVGDFEVWTDDDDRPDPVTIFKYGRCIAGGGYSGPSRIVIGGLTVFEITAEEWAEAVANGDAG